jgi:hypothetical protein
MILLCWAATFGSVPELSGLLAEPRATADSAVSGSWVPQDRATLGMLFYRGVELMREETLDAAESARTLLRVAAQGYRTTGQLDLVPVALGRLSEAERRTGKAEMAREIAREAATLLEHGSPSLLNEAPVYLALHDACVDLAEHQEAKDSIARGIPRLLTRVQGLAGTPYAKDFLTQLVANAGLLAAAEAYGLLPPEIAAMLEKS